MGGDLEPGSHFIQTLTLPLVRCLVLSGSHKCSQLPVYKIWARRVTDGIVVGTACRGKGVGVGESSVCGGSGRALQGSVGLASIFAVPFPAQ